MKFAVFVSLFVTAVSQNTAPDPNSDFFEAPPTNIDFPGCYNDLISNDKNGDGFVKKDEYLSFIQDYARKQKCINNPVLTLQQRIAFNTISCGCRSELGADVDCCIGENARIRTAGALNPDRTGAQEGYLTSACRITDETLGPSKCRPIDNVREETPLPPLPPLMIPPAPRAAAPADDPDWIWLALLAALLLLLCCCCVCVWRRRRAKEEEEEEEEQIPGKGSPGDAQEGAPEQSLQTPRDLEANYPTSAYNKAHAPNPEEEEEEEEARKRRGGGPLGEEYEEDGYIRYGAPRLPPPVKNTPEHKLKPIDPEDPEEDPDWDRPGRPIEYPKDKDDISAGEVEHYEPDGGVYLPERGSRDPIEMNPQWERGEPEDPDERDTRKHRIQSGLGEGEVWDKLANDDSESNNKGSSMGGAFDWVVQSALGALDSKSADAHEADETETTVL